MYTNKAYVNAIRLKRNTYNIKGLISSYIFLSVHADFSRRKNKVNNRMKNKIVT